MAAQSLAAYQPLGLAWEQAASLLLRASAATMLGDTAHASGAATDAVELLNPVGDAWGLVHAEAMLGAIAQAEHRFDDAARSLTHAAAASEQLGFLGQAAYHLTRLGRVQQQAGNNEAATATLTQAVEAATNCGDLRMAATASLNHARVLRATGRHDLAVTLLRQTDAWYRNSGGGDGALLTRSLLASMSPPSDGTSVVQQLETVLEEARHVEDREVEVLTLDALARVAAQRDELGRAHELLQAADSRTAETRDVVDEIDRVDAHIARPLLDHADPTTGTGSHTNPEPP
jgi:tetratricopeptide (TPR) repeat protein